ncbi:hypothetical protein O5D80_000746 [Batrachochytrium dendrobatidis]|nr:hypothetical protein O5D80_000746 [Batrachochytrium dendrobatidis]
MESKDSWKSDLLERLCAYGLNHALTKTTLVSYLSTTSLENTFYCNTDTDSSLKPLPNNPVLNCNHVPCCIQDKLNIDKLLYDICFEKCPVSCAMRDDLDCVSHIHLSDPNIEWFESIQRSSNQFILESPIVSLSPFNRTKRDLFHKTIARLPTFTTCDSFKNKPLHQILQSIVHDSSDHLQTVSLVSTTSVESLDSTLFRELCVDRSDVEFMEQIIPEKSSCSLKNEPCIKVSTMNISQMSEYVLVEKSKIIDTTEFKVFLAQDRVHAEPLEPPLSTRNISTTHTGKCTLMLHNILKSESLSSVLDIDHIFSNSLEEFDSMISDHSIAQDLLSCVSHVPNVLYKEVRDAAFDQPSTHRLKQIAEMPALCLAQSSQNTPPNIKSTITLLDLKPMKVSTTCQLEMLSWDLTNALVTINKHSQISSTHFKPLVISSTVWRKELLLAEYAMDVFSHSRKVIQQLMIKYEPLKHSDLQFLVDQVATTFISQLSELPIGKKYTVSDVGNSMANKRTRGQYEDDMTGGMDHPSVCLQKNTASIVQFSVSDSVNDYIRIRDKSATKVFSRSMDAPSPSMSFIHIQSPSHFNTHPPFIQTENVVDSSEQLYTSSHIYLATPAVFLNGALVNHLANRYHIELYERSYGLCNPKSSNSVQIIALDERNCTM